MLGVPGWYAKEFHGLLDWGIISPRLASGRGSGLSEKPAVLAGFDEPALA